MSIWNGLKASGFSTSRGSYLPPDVDVEVEIDRVHLYETREKGTAFIVDFTIVGAKRDAEPSIIGASRNWFQGLVKKDTAFRNVNSFLVAALGLHTEDDKAAINAYFLPRVEMIAMAATGPANPFRGARVCVKTRQIQAKTTGQDFTAHDWYPAFDGSTNAESRIAAIVSGTSVPAPVASAPAVAPPPPAPTMLSPDGRFAWNGTAWIPR